MQFPKWSDISKYRNELFGLSIISIIIFHYFEEVNVAGNAGGLLSILTKLYYAALGSVGVDVFLFLSGFGIWFSLSKGPRITEFYGKRVIRVVVPYLILGGIFWIIKDLVIGGASIGRFLYDYSLLSFWGDDVRTYWYISLILILYVVSPAVFRAGRRMCIAVSVLSIICAAALYSLNGALFASIEIAILRIPVYFAGMYCADFSAKKLPITWQMFAGTFLFAIAKVVGDQLRFPFCRLFNVGYSMFLIFLYLLLRNMLKQDIRLTDFFTRTGALSLELFIIHVGIRNIMEMYFDMSNPFIFCICIVATIPIAVLFSKWYDVTSVKRRLL